VESLLPILVFGNTQRSALPPGIFLMVFYTSKGSWVGEALLRVSANGRWRARTYVARARADSVFMTK